MKTHAHPEHQHIHRDGDQLVCECGQRETIGLRTRWRRFESHEEQADRFADEHAGCGEVAS
jgi:hypothetical protein